MRKMRGKRKLLLEQQELAPKGRNLEEGHPEGQAVFSFTKNIQLAR